MEYWPRAARFARENARMFALWKAVPTVLGGAVYILLHLQAPGQILVSVGIAVGCYIVLYILEFVWKLLVLAPAILDRERLGEIQERDERIAALSVKPFDEAHEALIRGEVETLTEPCREVLRFILHHPRIEARSIPVPDGGPLAVGLFNQGLLDRNEDRPGHGMMAMRTYYTVKDEHRPVLQDIFYPRTL